ncbi:zinc finger domain-containing protein [Streptomyces platensis]
MRQFSPRRSPYRHETRTVSCPRCGAGPGSWCIEDDGRARGVNHQGRVRAFLDARELTDPSPAGGSTHHPPRDDVRAVSCPRCLVSPFQPCTGSRGQSRESNHYERVVAFTGV